MNAVFRLRAETFAVGLRFDRNRLAPTWSYDGGDWVAIDGGGYLRPGALIRPVRGDIYDASTDGGATWFPQRIVGPIQCEPVGNAEVSL